MSKQKDTASTDPNNNKKQFFSTSVVHLGEVKTLTNGNKYKDMDSGGSQNGYKNHSS